MKFLKALAMLVAVSSAQEIFLEEKKGKEGEVFIDKENDKKKEEPAKKCYKQVEGCVSGANIKLYNGKTVEECQEICDADKTCKGFEMFVKNEDKKQVSKYVEGDCQPQSGADVTGCDWQAQALNFWERDGQECASKMDLEQKGKQAYQSAKKYIRGAYDYIEGGIQIGLGIFVCFYGGAMIEWTIKILVFFGLTAGLFLGFTAVNDSVDLYPGFTNKEQTPQLIIGGACMVLAGGATYLLTMKLITKQNVTKIIGFGVAALLVFLIVAGINMNQYIKYGCMVAGGIAGVYLMRGNENQVVAYGSGFIGAVLICHGIGSYVGGFPSFSNVKKLDDFKIDYYFIGYIVGILVLAICGGYKQMRVENDKDDEFMKQEDM